jgi:hypothetical protein
MYSILLFFVGHLLFNITPLILGQAEAEYHSSKSTWWRNVVTLMEARNQSK